MAKLSIQSLQISMNELSNHDHSRFLTRTNMTPGRVNTHGPEAASLNINKGIMKEAITFQMTWPGSPTIYYADEAGSVGWTDPDNRRTYPWGHEDKELLEYHKATIAIHKSYKALKTGSVEYLECSYGILAYGRFDEENKLIIVLNNNNQEHKVNISAWRIGIKINSKVRRLIQSTKDGFDINQEYYVVREGKLEITMPAHSSVILIEEYLLFLQNKKRMICCIANHSLNNMLNNKS
jgi:alpha-glucosidase